MSRIAVIGGGLSGLTAGIYLKEKGHDVDIYEKNAYLGGRLTAEDAKGNLTEPYVRALIGSSKNDKMHELWETIGAIDEDSKFIRLKRFQTVESHGEKLVLWRDLERTKKELTMLSPEDEEAVNKLLDAVAAAGVERINVKKPIDMTNQFELMAGGIVSGNANKKLDSYENIDVGELAAGFNHPLIRLAITSVCAPNLKAYEFISAYGNFVAANAEIPLGGFLKIIEKVEKKFRSLGGIIHTESEVVKVDSKGKRILSLELKNGDSVKADAYIFAMDARFVFDKLLSEKNMQRDMKKAFEKAATYPVNSLFAVLFSLEEKTDDLYSNGCLETEGLMIGADMRSKISYRFFDYDESFENSKGTYLFAYVLQDEEDYSYWNSISIDKESLEKSAMQSAENILLKFEETHKVIKGKMKIEKVFTPIYYADKYNSYLGAQSGFLLGKKSGNYNVSGNIKGIKNAFLAGSFVGGVSGIRGSVISGKFAALRVLKEIK